MSSKYIIQVEVRSFDEGIKTYHNIIDEESGNCICSVEDVKEMKAAIINSVPTSYHDEVFQSAKRVIVDLETQLKEMEDNIRNWGVIEFMVRNPNVDSFVKDKEAQLKEANNRIMELECMIDELRIPEKKDSDEIWENGCDMTVPKALMYLANCGKIPEGGEQSFNMEHLFQLNGEITRSISAVNNRIFELEARHNEDMAEILNLYRILWNAGYDKTASGWIKVSPDKTQFVDDGEIM